MTTTGPTVAARFRSPEHRSLSRSLQRLLCRATCHWPLNRNAELGCHCWHGGLWPRVCTRTAHVKRGRSNRRSRPATSFGPLGDPCGDHPTGHGHMGSIGCEGHTLRPHHRPDVYIDILVVHSLYGGETPLLRACSKGRVPVRSSGQIPQIYMSWQDIRSHICPGPLQL